MTGDSHGEEAICRWRLAHGELLRIARDRAGLDFDEGSWLLAALRSGTHRELGFGSFSEYVERLFGYAPRLTHDKLRVAEALEELPEMAQSLRSGGLSWSALRELTRVAVPATELAWFEVAHGKSVREIEGLVSGHRPGSLPGDPVDESARRHVLRFEVSGEALATFREAMAKIRRDAGGHIDDDAALLLMARQVLGGPSDEGRSSYQVAMTVCKNCRMARVQGRGDAVPVGREVAEMALCDTQSVGEDAPNGRDAPNAPQASTHVGQAIPRAAQGIPPAVRRAVLRRDQHRCVFPGCRHAVFVDVHHITTRAAGGKHELDNLVTACSAHHRAIHLGAVHVEGRVSTGLQFSHADGTPYGGPVRARQVEVQASAFRALRRLGFAEAEVRRALKVCARDAETRDALELTIRRALRELTEGAYATAS